MEHNLLPVFKEAVAVTKEISHNPNYFKDDSYVSRLLYAMSMVSLTMNSLNANNISAEQKKKNIEKMDLFGERHFYNENGSLGRIENVFKRSEIEAFEHQMGELNASYYDDALIQRCLRSVKMDAGVGMWSGNQPVISPDGKILDWKKASKSNIFKFAVSNIKNAMFFNKMDKQSKENNWDSVEWEKNYPIVNRECEKTLELEIAKFCLKKQEPSVVGLAKNKEDGR